MFSPESLHKPLPHVKRRRGSSPPKIGSGQILKETSIYRVQWHSYFPERWLKEAGQNGTSRGRVTSQGWVIGISQDEKSEGGGELYLWSRSGKDASVFSLEDMDESHLESAPDRVCPIFEGDEAGQLLGLVFVSSSGLIRFWSHYTDPQHFLGGEVPVSDVEYCTSLENAYVPHTLSLVCGTSLGRIFLLQCTDASNNLCDAVVTELTRPQSMMTRLFRFGQANTEVRRIISLQNFDASEDNGGTFVLTETALSFWRLSANGAHAFVWEDKLSNVLVQYPGVRFLDVACRTAESVTHELLLLCRTEDLCFVAVLDILDPTSKPQLARCVECTVPPRELDENLRVVSVEGNLMAAFIVGAISITNVPFVPDDREKDHVFNRLERKALSCLGGGVHDGAVYLLAEGYGMLTLQYMPPTADKHPRQQQPDDEDEKKEVDEGSLDLPKRLEIAFELFVDRTKTWEHKAQSLLQQSTPMVDSAVLAFTERLVQSRPRTEYTATIDFAILRHHLIQKRTRYESWLQFLKYSMLWGERLSEHAQFAVLEFGEKLTILERVWEFFQDSKDQDEKVPRDAFLRKLIERSNGTEDGLSAIEVFFSDALGVAKVILNLKSLLPAQDIQSELL